MPTRKQMNDLWMSGWRDDDRIGLGGFEAPNGRQWHEPSKTHDIPEFTGERIGYMYVDPITQEIRIVRDFMLSDFTDSDDQDWQDFITLNSTKQ